LRKALNYFFVAVILIGLPFYAWYYLNKGERMRKDAMADLQPKAEVGNFQSVTDADSLFYAESFRGKKWIVGIVGADSMRAKHLDVIKNIYNQAKEGFRVNFFTIVGLFPGELIPDMRKQLDLPTDANWTKTYMAAQHVYKFSEDAFSLPQNMLNKNVVVFVDEDGKILQFYSLDDKSETVKLVRQLPVFLSLK
jgi:hypothetical protein